MLLSAWNASDTHPAAHARSARTIAATLGKHPLWLRDRAWLPKLDVDGLPAWGRGKDASSALSCFMSCMFSHAVSARLPGLPAHLPTCCGCRRLRLAADMSPCGRHIGMLLLVLDAAASGSLLL